MTTFQKKTVTLTWGCQAENHVGMQKVGKGLSNSGFSSKNLEQVKNLFEEKGFNTYLYDLNSEIKEIEETGIFDISKAGNISNKKRYRIIYKFV